MGMDVYASWVGPIVGSKLGPLKAKTNFPARE
jgi:hypothetical protein